MSFEYIEQSYGLTFKKGQIVRALGVLGVAVKATNYVFVRHEGDQKPLPYHPTDVKEAQ